MDQNQIYIVYDYALYWDITKVCNFDCPQCAGFRTRLTDQNKPIEVDIPSLKRFLDRWKGKTFKFNFTGGEPLLVENIIETLSEISKNHYIGLITNLVNPKAKLLAESLNPARFTYINASAHFMELEKKGLTQTFIDNVVSLHKKGFRLTISEVAYPFIKDKAEYYREIFRKLGLRLNYNAFRGVWNKKNYPAAYTKDEIGLFDLNNEDIPEFRPDIFKRKGKLCSAGYNNVIILENGDAYPCYGLLSNKDKLGNIYDEIHFQKNLVKCPAKICTCPFPSFESKLFDKAIAEIHSEKKGSAVIKLIKD